MKNYIIGSIFGLLALANVWISCYVNQFVNFKDWYSYPTYVTEFAIGVLFYALASYYLLWKTK